MNNANKAPKGATLTVVKNEVMINRETADFLEDEVKAIKACVDCLYLAAPSLCDEFSSENKLRALLYDMSVRLEALVKTTMELSHA
jgi:hypothetical protein